MSDKLIDMSTIKMGADPEVFVFDVKTQKFKSAIGFVGGTKDEPRPLEKGISVQEDNVLLEFNIPASATKEQFIFNIENGLYQIGKLLPEHLEVKIQASAFLPMEELTDPRASEFGCTPDHNAWLGGDPNFKPAVPDNGLRSAGGHIHIGYEMMPLAEELGLSKGELNIELIKLCDLYLGVPSLILDTDTNRRQLYGKAGAFRHKNYGVEYRTLSSFWLKDVSHIDWAYSQTFRALEKAATGEFVDEDLGLKIQGAINTGNHFVAREMVKDHKLELIS